MREGRGRLPYVAIVIGDFVALTERIPDDVSTLVTAEVALRRPMGRRPSRPPTAAAAWMVRSPVSLESRREQKIETSAHSSAVSVGGGKRISGNSRKVHAHCLEGRQPNVITKVFSTISRLNMSIPAATCPDATHRHGRPPHRTSQQPAAARHARAPHQTHLTSSSRRSESRRGRPPDLSENCATRADFITVDQSPEQDAARYRRSRRLPSLHPPVEKNTSRLLVSPAR